MAGKHQIWSSNKATRSAAGRKWRHVANQQVGQFTKMTVRHARNMTRKGKSRTSIEKPYHPKPIGTLGEFSAID